jgi:transposase
MKRKALIIIFHLYGISLQMISEFLFISKKVIKRYIHKFKQMDVASYLDCSHDTIKISEDPALKELLISIIHSPPSQYGINRTSWKIDLLKDVLASKGYDIGKNSISLIIKKAGYKFLKAKEVLTSNDPNYREKVEAITLILSKLRSNEKFFSIDEFGPFAVKEKGGRRLVRKDEHPTFPQWQESKGCLIITAALELSTNQVTHFYSTKKNSREMIKLMHILIETYSGNKTIYLSWDCASWHSSINLMKAIDEVNKYKYRKKYNTPIVKLAPLPAQAQFLNVIESIFSGMATAIIHNSNYQSVAMAKAAIDRYFMERNENFRTHPQKAGGKIWGKELVAPKFKQGQNCKNPRWR